MKSIIKNKIGASEWSIGKLLTLVMVVILVIVVAVGWSAGMLDNFGSTLEGIWDGVLVSLDWGIEHEKAIVWKGVDLNKDSVDDGRFANKGCVFERYSEEGKESYILKESVLYVEKQVFSVENKEEAQEKIYYKYMYEVWWWSLDKFLWQITSENVNRESLSSVNNILARELSDFNFDQGREHIKSVSGQNLKSEKINVDALGNHIPSDLEILNKISDIKEYLRENCE